MALRTAFSYPARTPSWFAGHMARSLQQLPALLDEVDLVLEARDARLPLTSTNPAFDALLERVWGHDGTGLHRKGKGKEKIVVYTKRDLAEERYEAPLTSAFSKLAGQRITFVDTRTDSEVRSLLRTASQSAAPEAVDLKILVVGMPNVGKSSLLNALRRVGVRKGKAFMTGAMPGITRKLTGTVRVLEKPPTYVFDTPGVMMPYLGPGDLGAERGLKLALTNGIKDDLFELENISDYLLWKLNLRMEAEKGRVCYTEGLTLPTGFERTDDLPVFLDALATRLGALKKGGERDLEAAMAYFVKQFREGKLGTWTLDDVDGAEARYLQAARSAAAVSEEEVASSEALTDSVTDQLAQEQTTPPQSQTPPEAAGSQGELSLDAQVSETVAGFLKQAAEEREDADAGRNMSATQQKKSELRAKADYRIAKMKAKGIDKWATASWNKGTGEGRGYARGHKKAPPKGRKR